MNIKFLLPIFCGVVAVILTPFITALLSRFSPPSKFSPYDGFSKEELQHRNGVINGVASVLCFAGIWIGVALYGLGVDKSNPWPVGLGFGLMAILPVTFITLATLTQGIKRYEEFWRFYELKNKMSIKILGVIYFCSRYWVLFRLTNYCFSRLFHCPRRGPALDRKFLEERL